MDSLCLSGTIEVIVSDAWVQKVVFLPIIYKGLYVSICVIGLIYHLQTWPTLINLALVL